MYILEIKEYGEKKKEKKRKRKKNKDKKRKRRKGAGNKGVTRHSSEKPRSLHMALSTGNNHR